MSRIIKLDAITASKIAAGEVVEKPAMVVKELVENAIDAGANTIQVDIKKGGKRQIRVSDNGEGIDPLDVELLFERHATSKIKTLDDLYNTKSLGFRGEALASISAVSEVLMITKKTDKPLGIELTVTGGKIVSTKEIGAVNGTTLTVSNLFYNTPARLKFLKSDQAETKAITDLMSHLALSHPEIAFKYYVEDKRIFQTPGKGHVKDAIFSVFDKDMIPHLFEFNSEEGETSVKGYASTLSYTKGTSQYQVFFVNGRYVKSDIIKEVVNLVYKPYMMHNRYPACFIFLDINPLYIDVNIHPAKTEIKFHDEGRIKQLIYTGIKKSLMLHNQAPDIKFTEKEVFKRTPELIEDGPEFIERKAEISEYKPKIKNDQVGFTGKFNHNGVKETHDFSDYDLTPLSDFSEEVSFFSEPLENESIYDGLQYVGTFLKTYLIFEKNEKMVLIDQHAAHEKILYELFMDQYRKNSIDTQMILIPEIVTLSPSEMIGIEEKIEWIESTGFSINMIGSDSIAIRGIPSIFDLNVAKALLKSIFEGLSSSIEIRISETLMMKACKSAIKAYDSVDEIEVNKLVSDLKNLKEPYTCPHGRPIVINFTKQELERKFKRVL